MGTEQVYIFLTRCYFFENKMDKASETIIELSELLPKKYEYYELLANMYIEKKDTASAISYLEKALMVSPDNPALLEKLNALKSN